MKKNSVEEREITHEELANRAAKRKNVIAFAVCALIAFILWLAIMNSDVPVTEGDPSNLPFELSEVRVETTV